MTPSCYADIAMGAGDARGCGIGIGYQIAGGHRLVIGVGDWSRRRRRRRWPGKLEACRAPHAVKKRHGNLHVRKRNMEHVRYGKYVRKICEAGWKEAMGTASFMGDNRRQGKKYWEHGGG